MLTPGTRVQCRWSGKLGTVLPPERACLRKHGALVRLDPFVPQWGGEPTPALSGIEVIYLRRDLKIVVGPAAPTGH